MNWKRIDWLKNVKSRDVGWVTCNNKNGKKKPINSQLFASSSKKPWKSRRYILKNVHNPNHFYFVAKSILWFKFIAPAPWKGRIVDRIRMRDERGTGNEKGGGIEEDDPSPENQMEWRYDGTVASAWTQEESYERRGTQRTIMGKIKSDFLNIQTFKYF